ncbi:DinB family protein [Streptomyces johnsoniae]|uniref:DinB family protein n=1 Tax=Streptomyces johnsoniae TaxID=3075532 RepID=A0ABU2S4Z0_9ACTN|nr:DinB family protein [Streptomyces sp. DSM 41886]MDT0443977.1 DinB family protein [Streptomyces sp. DSM 41886]
MSPASPDATPPAPAFGWSDMFVHPDEDPRSDGRFRGERDNLVGYLADQRLTLAMKCEGLDAEALARRSVPPSPMSLLGLVRHMADVELGWFRQVLAGQDVPRPFRTAEDPDADFNGAVADPRAVEEAFAAWRTEIAFAERFVAEAPDLGVTGRRARDGEPVELREVMVHMIEEYARHNGHADLLRERIDGRVGQ